MKIYSNLSDIFYDKRTGGEYNKKILSVFLFKTQWYECLIVRKYYFLLCFPTCLPST